MAINLTNDAAPSPASLSGDRHADHQLPPTPDSLVAGLTLAKRS